jgi:YrbI family 3-deoxy-D-manno-octulosonate 8-phosphate phosphatase
VAANKTLAERCSGIELLIVDVDGVLTDGGITYADDGAEIKQFHVRDGSGLKIWHRLGKRAAIITGRKSRVVETRARELDVDFVFQGTRDKLADFRQILAATRLAPEQACSIGDDVTDLPVMRHSGLAVAPADGCPEVVADAHYVTCAPGGRGAVRETVEVILQCQGKWQAVVERHRNMAK